MKDRKDLTVPDYIHGGVSWIPITQLHFLDIVSPPEFKIQGIPTRTLNHFLDEDFVATVGDLRRIYIPNYEEVETDLTYFAFEWAKSNLSVMQEFWSGRDETVWNQLHEVVQAYHRTVSFPFVVAGDQSGKINSYPHVNVAFSPDSPDFQKDVHRLTLGAFDRLRLHCYEDGNEFNPDGESTSRSARFITKFFWSGGEMYRTEATDMLTWGLLMRYWTELKQRLKVTQGSTITKT